MGVTQDIANARVLFERAERETSPELKAHALEEATNLLASLDPDELSEGERQLVANVRLAHTRRLLVQLVSLTSVSMDAWFEYIDLLVGELRPEVERLTETDGELKENYGRFLSLWGPEIAEIVRRQQSNGREEA
jgi:hypothetical protein